MVSAILRKAFLAAAAATFLATSAFAGGTLRIGMTAADIPLTIGQTDLRLPHRMGSDQRRHAFPAPGTSRGMERRSERADQMDLQDTQGREVS